MEPRAALVLDAILVGLVSIVACATRSDLKTMTLLVAVAWAGRLCFSALAPRRGERLAETALFLGATLLGGFNDFNTVVIHGVYRYRVAVFSPDTGSIPLWMLLFWGLILRFSAGLAWSFAGMREAGGRPAARLLFLLSLVAVTRLSIFRYSRDPVASWAPFAAASVAYFAVLRPARAHYVLFAGVLAIGTAVEVLFIRAARMHEYDLGLVGGVPLWISLWWGLGVLIWQEIAARFRRAMIDLFNGRALVAQTPGPQ